MVQEMQPGSVIVDVAVDQGGSIETIDRVTTHSEPIYIKHDIVHYAVSNMPGAVPKTSTIALTNVTIPYAVEIATKGLEAAISVNHVLAHGINVFEGNVTYEGVAESLGLTYTPLREMIGRQVV
jgi:alanine dehydrogenase